MASSQPLDAPETTSLAARVDKLIQTLYRLHNDEWPPLAAATPRPLIPWDACTALWHFQAVQLSSLTQTPAQDVSRQRANCSAHDKTTWRPSVYRAGVTAAGHLSGMYMCM